MCQAFPKLLRMDSLEAKTGAGGHFHSRRGKKDT